MEKSSIDFLDILLITKKNLKSLFLVFFITAVLSIIVSLLLPKWYRATATIMPPQATSQLNSISSLVSNLGVGGVELFGGASGESLTYIAILQSRTVFNKIIKKFNLVNVYHVRNLEEARKKLRDNSEIKLDDEGTISISVLEKNPVLAANIANAFCTYLDSVHVKLNVQKARNNRIFLEKRLNQEENILKRAEEKLKDFQEKYKAIELTEQTKAEIGIIADLQSQIYETEVELKIKENSLSPRHPELARLRLQLNEMKNKLNQLVQSSKVYDSSELFIPMAKLPDLGLQYARLLRDVKVHSKISLFLMQQYEQAKFEEAKKVSSIQILDKATPPIRKSKPKRAVFVLIITLSVSFFYWLILLLYDRLENLKSIDPNQFKKASKVFPFLKK